jgi:hypothetical protein
MKAPQACTGGSYQDDQSQTNCKACPLGTASSAQRAVVCPDCSPGTFSNDLLGAWRCLDCDPGTYQDSDGQSSWSASVAAADARPCSCWSLIGALAASRARRANSMPRNWPNRAPPPVSGVRRCLKADLSLFAGPGQFVAAEGRTSSVRCPAGEYQDGFNASACKVCWAFLYCHPHFRVLLCVAALRCWLVRSVERHGRVSAVRLWQSGQPVHPRKL